MIDNINKEDLKTLVGDNKVEIFYQICDYIRKKL